MLLGAGKHGLSLRRGVTRRLTENQSKILQDTLAQRALNGI